MKILIADKFEDAGVDQLRLIADAVEIDPSLKDETLTAKITAFQPNVVIVRSTQVQKPQIDAGQALKLIIRAGSGYNTIDIAHAREKHVRVSNCPGMNAVAVAELVMGHMLNIDRRIADNVADLRAHRWNKKLYSKARGLKGRVLGIVGAGAIGRAVAQRALAFDMTVLYFDILPNIKLADHPNCRRAEVEEIFRTADFITLHVPGTGETKHLVNAEKLALMKPDAALINTSRASVIDEPALMRALQEGQIRAAGVDVYEEEPAADAKEITSPLANVENLYGTHHIGASTDQAQLAVAEETVRIVKVFKETGKAENCVNL